MRRHLPLAVGALVGMSVAAACAPADDRSDEITVAAASNVRFAFQELAASFEEDTGVEVVLTFGSSGQIASQIDNGAPFDLFASADVAYVDQVVDAGRAAAEDVQVYAVGRLVTWSADGTARTIEDVATPEVRSLAVANPDHAPYGQAAVEALEAAGVWGAVEERVVLGENIADTLRLARSGNADVAIVALALVIDEPSSRWTLVDASLHGPITQAAVVTATDPERARLAADFLDLVVSEDGRAVLAEHGFESPDGGGAS